MNKLLVFGHKNPDTDSVCSAISYGYVLKELGNDVDIRVLGSISKETQFALDSVNMSAPALLESVSKGDNVVLVDHNEFTQSVLGIEQANIVQVVDHHRISNFQTSDPIYMNVQPVGCTSTIIYKIMKEKDINIPEDIATLMISAIISDTLLFKSPTCTKDDVAACKELNKIANLDLGVYGMDLLKSGTDLGDFSPSELLNLDAKEFQTVNGNFKVAQLNTVDIDELLSNMELDLRSSIDDEIKNNNLDSFILLVTDIINSNSLVLIKGNRNQYFSEKFNVTLSDDKAILAGVVSRKKQIVPFL